LAETGRPAPWQTLLATFFGAGLLPKAPGTAGTFAAAALLLPGVMLDLPCLGILAGPLLLLTLLIGALSVPGYLRATGLQDPGAVVIDEAAGLYAGACLLRPTWLELALVVVLFRLLDIAKPFPVNRLERLPGAWGVMADDLAAGLLAGLLTLFSRTLF